MIEVEKIWLTDDAVWIRTKDGSEVCEMYRDYPRLATADKKLIELFFFAYININIYKEKSSRYISRGFKLLFIN